MTERRAASILIGLAAFAVLLLAAYQVGARQGRGQPLPAHPWPHGVAFRLRQRAGV